MAVRSRMQLRFADMAWFDQLSDEQLGALVRALLSYAQTGTEPILSDPLVKLAFGFLRTVDDEDARRYEQVCERNSANGKKGGRPRKDDHNTEHETAEKPTAFFETEKTQSQTQTQTHSQTESQSQTHCFSQDETKQKEETAGCLDLLTAENDVFLISAEDREAWGKEYPYINVFRELYVLRYYLNSYPTERPGRDEMRGCCERWLSRKNEQARPRSKEEQELEAREHEENMKRAKEIIKRQYGYDLTAAPG